MPLSDRRRPRYAFLRGACLLPLGALLACTVFGAGARAAVASSPTAASVDVLEAVPGISLDAAAHDFGTWLAGSVGAAQSLTLTNSGTAPLVVGSVTISGFYADNFLVIARPVVIAPGERGAVRLVFAPMAAGSRAATLTINSNAPGGPQTVTLTGTAVQPAPRYTIVDLGPFPGGTRSSASAINASGQVAGSANDAQGLDHAFIWDRAGMHDPGILAPPGGRIVATGLNDGGQVVGTREGPRSEQAFLYSGGVTRELGTLGGASSFASGINNAGRVVGQATLAGSPPGQDGPIHAFLYDSSGMHDLTPLDRSGSAAYAINKRGQVVGFSAGVTGAGFAFLWENGVMKNLGQLPVDPGESVAMGINDAGQIVGTASTNSSYHAFVYDNTGMHDLGTLGGSSSQADGINAAGQVVGFAQTGRANQDAFLYSDGVMMDLNDLVPLGSGWELDEARAINDAGQIVGDGFLDGQERGFLLIPGLDPSTAPKAPSNLSARWVFPNEIDLAWTGNSPDAHSFELQMKQAGGDWVGIALVPANTPTFADDGLQGGIQYIFRVRAVNGAGASDWSSEASDDTGVHPDASVYPTGTLYFGTEPLGTASYPQQISITGAGDAPLIYSVTLAGADPDDFSFTGDGEGGLLPGGTRTVILEFTPRAAGRREALLLVTDNAAGKPTLIPLTGTGLAPAASFSAGNLSFGAVMLGDSSATRSLALANTGDAPLTIGGIALAGANAGDYRITADSGQSTLPPGATRTLTLRFTPLALGDTPASLTITDNAVGGQQSVKLSGTGVLPDGHSLSAALIPTSGELFIAALDGTAGHSAKAVVSVGQSVTVALQVKFPNGAVADVSADRLCAFGTGTAVGQFTAKNVWLARPQDQGKTVVISGSYRSPVSGRRITGAVTVTVRAVRADRRNGKR